MCVSRTAIPIVVEFSVQDKEILTEFNTLTQIFAVNASKCSNVLMFLVLMFSWMNIVWTLDEYLHLIESILVEIFKEAADQGIVSLQSHTLVSDNIMLLIFITHFFTDNSHILVTTTILING